MNSLFVRLCSSLEALWSCITHQLQRPLLGSMEPGAGRLSHQVLGENEALQQFFSGKLLHVISFITSFLLLLLETILLKKINNLCCENFKIWKSETIMFVLKQKDLITEVLCRLCIEDTYWINLKRQTQAISILRCLKSGILMTIQRELRGPCRRSFYLFIYF